ncbi:MAG: prepilin-type N-terminal cleavage/methylation domain-containing protein [bacterium]|nr:prepilin-type N-terminal cleavage/methylation domain-containing protein [bacterium]
MNIKYEKKGFTLVEVVLYVGVLGVLLVAISNLMLGTMANYKTSSIKDELASSGYQVFGFFFREIKNANSINISDSLLSNDLGVLSLASPFQLGSGSVGKAELYLSGGRIMFKREGETPLVLTSDNIEITKFKFVRVTPRAGLEGVRFYLDFKSKIKPAETFSLTTFTMLRGGYTQ